MLVRRHDAPQTSELAKLIPRLQLSRASPGFAERGGPTALLQRQSIPATQIDSAKAVRQEGRATARLPSVMSGPNYHIRSRPSREVITAPSSVAVAVNERELRAWNNGRRLLRLGKSWRRIWNFHSVFRKWLLLGKDYLFRRKRPIMLRWAHIFTRFREC